MKLVKAYGSAGQLHSKKNFDHKRSWNAKKVLGSINPEARTGYEPNNQIVKEKKKSTSFDNFNLFIY